MADDWVLTINDMKTGAFIRQLAPAGDARWSTSLDGTGESTSGVKVNDAEQPWTPDKVAEMFEPNDRLICRWWNDTCMYAHKIDDWEYDQDAGLVTVSAVDMIGEADWRQTGPVSSDKNTTVLTVTNRSAAGAVRAIFARAMQGNADWAWPIDLPADGSGSVSATWEFWRKLTASDLIKQVEERFGVEVFLRAYEPVVGSRSIRFEMRVAPMVTVGTTSFILGATESPLAGIKYRVGGKQQITDVLGVGNGTGVDQATAYAGIGAGAAPIAIRNTVHSFPDLTGTALQEATNKYYEANKNPIVQWSIGSYTIGNLWSPGHAAPGRLWKLSSKGDPVIPDGPHTVRVIKVSGDNSRVMKTEVQDVAA